ncbi:MAG: hypothetical protein ACOX1F_01335 [Erysipelotrichaceae bacterium]|jgi:hypothetical protein
MRKHILGLLVLFALLFLAVFGLNKLDETIKMPFIENFKTEEVDENLILANEYDEFVNSINNPVTLEDESLIIEAVKKYENLPSEAQEKVTTLEKLEDYQKQLKALKDQKAATEVINLINSLNNSNDVNAVNAARTAYENLSEEQKELVTNLFILEENEEQLKKVVTNTNLNVGDIVIFKGGKVYSSSQSGKYASRKPQSRCKVTHVARNAAHPYHLVSLDGKKVYGWVNVKDIEKE